VPIDSELLHLEMEVFEKMKKKLVVNNQSIWNALEGFSEVGID
jgi:hypothetical protein